MVTIDFQGALFPNLTTFLVQLGTLLVLFYFTIKWLFKPARKILEDRKDKMQKDLDDANILKNDALTYLNDAKQTLDNAKVKSNEIIETAKHDAVLESEKILEQANKQAQIKLEQTQDKINANYNQIKNKIQDEIVDVAFIAVEKLMKQKANQVDDKEALNNFVEEIIKENK